MNNRVSVLVPIYGVESKIERCAISLFEQTYHNIEYIFVNDCTKDKSIDILINVIKKYPNRKNNCHIIHHIENKGLSAARNTALKHSTGKYILNVDSDDFLDYCAIEKCIKTIDDADVCLFGSKHIFKTHNYIENIYSYKTTQNIINSILTRRFPVNLWGGLYKRDLYIKNNVYSIENIFMGEDYVTKPRLLYFAKKIVYLNEPLYNYMHYDNRNLRKSDIIDLFNCIFILNDFFQSKNDYYLYKKALEEAETITKISLLIDWAKSKERNTLLLNSIRTLFPASKDYPKLSINRRIILFISSKGWDSILHIYINLGLKIKNYIIRNYNGI